MEKNPSFGDESLTPDNERDIASGKSSDDLSEQETPLEDVNDVPGDESHGLDTEDDLLSMEEIPDDDELSMDGDFSDVNDINDDLDNNITSELDHDDYDIDHDEPGIEDYPEEDFSEEGMTDDEPVNVPSENEDIVEDSLDIEQVDDTTDPDEIDSERFDALLSDVNPDYGDEYDYDNALSDNVENDADNVDLDSYDDNDPINGSPEWDDNNVNAFVVSDVNSYDPRDSVASIDNDNNVFDDYELPDFDPSVGEDAPEPGEEVKVKDRRTPWGLIAGGALLSLAGVLGAWSLMSGGDDDNDSDNNLSGDTTISVGADEPSEPGLPGVNNDVDNNISSSPGDSSSPTTTVTIGGGAGVEASNQRIRELEGELSEVRQQAERAPVIETTTVRPPEVTRTITTDRPGGESTRTITQTVPGPERVVTRDVPGPERVVTRNVPGPERVVTRNVPGPERVVTRTVPGDRVTVTKTIVERIR